METTIVSLRWADLLGGGVVAGIFLLALTERLRRTFATRNDLNGLGERQNALQGQAGELRKLQDELRERVAALESEQKNQAERVVTQVIRPLERITEKLENVSRAQAAQATALEHIGEWLGRLDHGRAPGRPPGAG